MNRRKWPGIVATSRETGTRSASAAIRRTSGSGCRPGSPLRRRENLLPVPAAAILGRSRGLGRRRPGNEGSILLLCPFALPSLKTLDHAGREGVAGLDLFVATILIFEICLDFFWMLQDKRNCAVDLGQRSDRQVGIKDRFGRPPIPKIVCNHVKSNSGSGDVVSTVPNFHILVGRRHGDSTSSLLQPAPAQLPIRIGRSAAPDDGLEPVGVGRIGGDGRRSRPRPTPRQPKVKQLGLAEVN